MKKTKLLTSLAAFVLVLGLGACNQPEEETSSDESGSTSQTTEGGTTEGGSGEGEGTTYKLGVLNENLYTYYYFDGTIDSGRFANGTATYDDAVALTLDEAEEGITLSWEADGKTYYLGYGLNESSQNCVIISEEVTYLKLNTTYNSIEDPEGKYFLGTYNEFTTMSWCGISYYDQDYIAHLYTEAQTNPTKPSDPEPSGEMTSVETGKLGLYQGNLGGYYYFTGTINDSNFGVLSADYSQAVDVTLWKDDAYYYLTTGENESLKYIACADTTKSALSLSDNPYCLQYNSDYDAYLTGDGKEFLATYSTYTTLSWANTDKYLGDDGEFIAHLYTEEQKLPAPTEITISGPTSVYVGATITLSADVEKGYDSSVVWSDDGTGHASVDATGVVTGNSVGETLVTATSAVDPDVSASITITVEAVPEGLIGSFDFSSSEKNGTVISDSTDLDGFWVGEDGLFRGVNLSNTSTVYIGNGSGGAFENEKACLKFGTGSLNGTLELDFATGVSIEKVELTAHSWSAGSTANQLALNGDQRDCSTSGTAELISYELGETTNILTFASTGRVTIHSISIYGSYDFTNINQFTELNLSATKTTLNIGESTDISVSYLPTDTIFDSYSLNWVSSDEDAITIVVTNTGATATAHAVGESTITATAENGVKGEVTLKVEDVLVESENIVISEINHGYSSNIENASITGHQVKITVDQNKNDDGNSSNAPLWSTDSVRVYYNQTVTFEPLYEEATITKIVITCDGNSYVGSSTATLKDLDGNTAGSVSADSTSGVVTIDVTSDGTVVYKNVKDGSNTQLRIKAFAITYTLAA